jgi:hypothetical protein
MRMELKEFKCVFEEMEEKVNWMTVYENVFLPVGNLRNHELYKN